MKEELKYNQLGTLESYVGIPWPVVINEDIISIFINRKTLDMFYIMQSRMRRMSNVFSIFIFFVEYELLTSNWRTRYALSVQTRTQRIIILEKRLRDREIGPSDSPEYMLWPRGKVGGRNPSSLLSYLISIYNFCPRLARLRWPASLIAVSPRHMLEASWECFTQPATHPLPPPPSSEAILNF